MKTSICLIATSALSALAAPSQEKRADTPTVYLAGDSTMAKKGAADGATDGWGQYLYKYLTVPVVNNAMAGRSARSYTNDGRFDRIAAGLKAGDIVVIEFGHNDGGSPERTDNNRSDCPGTGDETCKSAKDGSTVYTYNHYLEAAAKLFIEKGAKVVLSSQTPNNLWETGKFSTAQPSFVNYAKMVAETVGEGATFVDHFHSVANMYKKLSNTKTNALYPNDHTHTSPTGADLSARAFAQAIELNWNGTTPLAAYIKSGNPTVW